MATFSDVKDAHRHLMNLTRDFWLHHNLFTWQWWLLICLEIIPWIVWWRLVHKRRIVEILLYGCLVAVIALTLDIMGSSLLLWDYPQRSVWFVFPPMIPVDYGIVPVVDMLLYQYFRSWKAFLIAVSVFALSAAFIAEPLFHRGGMYVLNGWSYVYSFPLYIAKSVVARLAMEGLRRIELRSTR
ncbi:CBO0543 family protein [Alicyclobacillus acidiphilus]|uniref:CBO0543 family protein n=1 Tax=Alicyclobacillus acidiphilus TaxID=182455 RepID=UPI000833E622|nr:CBO0543 family protein [Alicyclobacillus acidiphilus]